MATSGTAVVCAIIVSISFIAGSCALQMDMYEGNNLSQDHVCTMSLSSGDNVCRSMHWMGCSNDEARSAVLRGARAGSLITIYDSPDCSTSDDYTTIFVVKDFSTNVALNTFEGSFTNEYVQVSFHHDNGLDGKVSAFRILVPN